MIKKYKNYETTNEKFLVNWELLTFETVIPNNVNFLHLFCSFQLNVAQELKDLV